MSEWAPKRFWKTAEAVVLENGYGVVLDGRPVRTPAKAVLWVPSQALAQEVAVEFDAQADQIDPRTMPFTRTANAAIDKVAVQQSDVADMLAAYGDSDLLCYRADAPQELVARQNAQWDPLLDWAAETLNARLEARVGVIHKPQDPVVLANLSKRVHKLTPFELSAFHDLVSISGSLIIGFAAQKCAQVPEDLWDLSRVDENWQAEQWGEDDDAQQMVAYKKAAFLHADRFMRLINMQSAS